VIVIVIVIVVVVPVVVVVVAATVAVIFSKLSLLNPFLQRLKELKCLHCFANVSKYS